MQRRLFEAEEEADTARIERDMETSRADIAQRNADVMFAALLAIARGDADAVKIANDALEGLE